MKEENYYYKGFDITDFNKKEKLVNEYFNPYGYNISSNKKRIIDYNFKSTHTNQDNKRK